MSNQDDRLGLILERNAQGQLAGVDWEALSASISGRLDATGRQRMVRYRWWLRIAAVIAVGAAFAAVLLLGGRNKPVNTRIRHTGAATAKLVPAASRTSARLIEQHSGSRATVTLHTGMEKAAVCDVRIIDPGVEIRDDSAAATWIIVTRPEPALAYNGQDKEIMSLICLF